MYLFRYPFYVLKHCGHPIEIGAKVMNQRPIRCSVCKCCFTDEELIRLQKEALEREPE